MRVTYPFLGTGIAFREIYGEDHRRLQDLVQSLASGRQRVVVGQPGPANAAAPPVVKDAAAALAALVAFFQTGSTMTRNEFKHLLKPSQG